MCLNVIEIDLKIFHHLIFTLLVLNSSMFTKNLPNDAINLILIFYFFILKGFSVLDFDFLVF